VYYRPKINIPSNIVGEEMFEYIYEWIPHRYRIRDLELLFKLSEDGINFNYFYNRAGDYVPTLLIIKTENNSIFGAFIPCKLETTGQMIGSAETFLYSITPTPQKYEYVQGAEEFFILAERKTLKIGFEGEGVGLSIKDEWKGSSHRCGTFNNPPLNGNDKQDDFLITEAELYVFI